MMWYRSNSWRGHRRYRRGIYGFPWGLVFFLFIFSHTWWWIFVGIALTILISLMMRGWASSANANYQQPYYQPTYQQPQQPYQQSQA